MCATHTGLQSARILMYTTRSHSTTDHMLNRSRLSIIVYHTTGYTVVHIQLPCKFNFTHSDPRLLDEKGRLPSLRTVTVSGRRSFTAKRNSILRKSVFHGSVHGNHFVLVSMATNTTPCRYTLRGLSPSLGWPLLQIFCPQTTRSRPR